MAVSDYILEIDGIKGECQDDKHKEKIDIHSYSWGCANSGGSHIGGGGGKGKVSFHDIHFTTRANKASPNLMVKCATGEHIKKAVLHIRKQGDSQQEYYTLTMEDLIISSYQSGGSGSPELSDNFSLNFARILFQYKAQKKDGSLEPYITGGWDVKANKSIGG